MTAVAPTLQLAGGSVVTEHGALQQLDVVVEHGRITQLVATRLRPAVHRSHDRRLAQDRRTRVDRRPDQRWLGPRLHERPVNDRRGRPAPPRDRCDRLRTDDRHEPAARTGICTGSVGGARTATEHSATALGLHFEGPLISPARPGAHDLDQIGFPPIAEFDSWTRDRGLAIVTLAPELAGVTELIARLVAAGVVVSVGHTACSASEFGVARAAGATMVTHLFNAMAPFSHRQPGPIGAALADGGVYAGLICDGIHADPVAVQMAWRALGPDHTVLVTDAVAALGLGAGTVRLGRHTLTISDHGVRNAAGVLAGSNLSLDQAIRNLVEFSGCSPAQAIRAASANPAALLGLEDRGRIEVGAAADLVVFSQDLQVERTIIGGHTAWKS